MIKISNAIFNEIIEHVLKEHPLEACGLLAGKMDEASLHYPIANQLASSVAYEMDPAEQLEAMLDFEEKELELRFGQSYLEYKRKVPFLIPNFRNITEKGEVNNFKP